MHYDQYLAHGWPIASGVIEGACRHLVKDRCELSGMRVDQSWRRNLALARVAENDDWAAYRHFFQQQRHQRLYGVAGRPDALENQALADPEPPFQPRPASRAFIVPTLVPHHSAQPQKQAA